jgi:hypothetical protein
VSRQTVRVSKTDEVDDTAVARYVAMNAYGEVMLRFQLLEMSYWRVLAARKPPGMSLGQHIAKLTEWDRQTGERLIKALGLPDDLRDEAMTAVNTRNMLAHRFLRERAVFLGDPLASNDAARVLAEVKVKIDEFEERLSAYMRELGIEELDEAEIEVLSWRSRPTSRRGRHWWPRANIRRVPLKPIGQGGRRSRRSSRAASGRVRCCVVARRG